MRFAGPVLRITGGRYYRGDYYGSRDDSGDLEAKLMPWNNALDLAVPKLVEEMDQRLTLIPPDSDQADDDTSARKWRPLLMASGALLSAGLLTNDLPVSGLVMGSGSHFDYGSSYGHADPFFERLCVAEQEYEKVFFVQFADQCSNPLELADKWSQWWAANKDKSREDWWRQAIGQAVGELTHASWWHRTRAARRLMRLTGWTFVVPTPFDLPGWAALQADSRKRIESEGVNPRNYLLTAAAKADGVGLGVFAASDVSHAGNDEAYLADLVRMAGFAPAPVSEAALLQLNTWPDRKQLVRQALSWQNSPRRELGAWEREQCDKLTGKSLLVYNKSDLDEAATRPANKLATKPAAPTSQPPTEPAGK